MSLLESLMFTPPELISDLLRTIQKILENIIRANNRIFN